MIDGTLSETSTTASASGLRPVVLLGTWTTDLDLAAALEPRLGGRRVVCLGPPSDEDAPELRRVDDWLARHFEQMRKLGVEPPYLLLGYSFGGVLALEMARQLAATSTVQYVGMIDTIRPQIRPLELRDAVPYHLLEAAMMPDRETQMDYLSREFRRRVVLRTPEWVLRSRRKLLGRPSSGRARTVVKATSPLILAIHRTWLQYIAQVTQLPVHIYPTKPSIKMCHGDPSLLWSRFLQGGFTIDRIDGTHTTLWLEHHIDKLASAMRSHLDAVDPPN